MEGTESKEFDIIIFGATGYAGEYCIEELANTSKSKNIKWAVAGRNVNKVNESLKTVQEYVGEGIKVLDVPVIEADVKNPESLSKMCKRTKVLLNCVGPYKFFGDPVVAACIENGTHHLDISGEVKYLETTQAKYFDAAQAKKVYIIGACGFDCVPGDYGITLLKNKFPGDLNSAEYFVHIGIGPSGKSLNIGTFMSAIYSVQDTLFSKETHRMLEEKVFHKHPPKAKYPLGWRFPPLFYSPEVKGWCLWFLGPDERVIERSQLFRYEYLNERPVESKGYVRFSSFLTALMYLLLGGVFGFMSLFSFGKYLLSTYPSFFTAGSFTTEGPTRQQVMESTTTVYLYGQGWKDKLSDPNDQHTTKPDTRMKLTISGPEPAYRLTTMCLVQAAVTILEESTNMPLEGGVLTPGVAFAKTSYYKRLENRGMKFDYETY